MLSGAFNNYVDKILFGQKMSVFDHAQGIKTVHAGEGGVKKWQNSVHVVVECPLMKENVDNLTDLCQLSMVVGPFLSCTISKSFEIL